MNTLHTEISAEAHGSNHGAAVMLLGAGGVLPLQALLARFGLHVMMVADAADIPGSYWGEAEAGLLRDVLYVRSDTPVHSALHEACHYICMDTARRLKLDRDAGGDYAEEDAVCYLQILLSDHLPGMNRSRMCADMDAWGYTFRLGSAQAWFEQDADTARQWLQREQIIAYDSRLTWKLRD